MNAMKRRRILAVLLAAVLASVLSGCYFTTTGPTATTGLTGEKADRAAEETADETPRIWEPSPPETKPPLPSETEPVQPETEPETIPPLPPEPEPIPAETAAETEPGPAAENEEVFAWETEPAPMEPIYPKLEPESIPDAAAVTETEPAETDSPFDWEPEPDPARTLPEPEDDWFAGTAVEDYLSEDGYYVVNTSTHRIHSPECRDIEKILSKNLSRTDYPEKIFAIDPDYRYCGHCNGKP